MVVFVFCVGISDCVKIFVLYISPSCVHAGKRKTRMVFGVFENRDCNFKSFLCVANELVLFFFLPCGARLCFDFSPSCQFPDDGIKLSNLLFTLSWTV